MTSPGSPIDRAFVEIEPDTRDFSRQLNHDVEEAYVKVDRQTSALTKKITKSFDAAGREIERTFTTIAKDGKVTTSVLERAFDSAGDAIERTFKVVSAEGVAAEELIAEVARVAADSTADAWERAGERIEDAFREANRVALIESLKMREHARAAEDDIDRKFTNPLRLGLQGLANLFSTVGGGIGEIATSIAGLSGGTLKLIAILGALVALAGPVIVLVGALGDLVGLIGPLPAAIGVLVAAILPLVFAFQGLGDAIKAVNDGDPEKIAEAMKGLAPAARSIVKEITGLNTVFDKFRKNVQQSFFAPIVGDLGSTIRILLPSLQKNIDRVATSLGLLAENFLAFLQQRTTIVALNNLFNMTSRIIDKLNVPLVNFLDTLLQLTTAGLPFITRLTDAFGGLLEKFRGFVEESIKTGAFNNFVEDAVATTKELLNLVGALGNLFSAVFSNFDDEGRGFIRTLADGINAMADFFRTADGRDVLDALVASIKVTVTAIVLLWKTFTFSVGQIKGWIIAVKAAGAGISNFIGKVGDFFASVGDAIVEGFNTVKDFVGGIVDAIGNFIDRAVEFFKALPGKILTAIKALPGLVIGLIQSMIDDFLHRIGIGIGLLVFAFQELPQLILAKLQQLAQTIASFFTQLWLNVVDLARDGIALLVSFIQQLPGIIGRFFVDAWNKAKQITTDGINAVVNFVKSLPGKIGALASSVGAAVANFFSKIFTGGKQKASSAVDAIIGFIRNLPSRLGSFVNDVGGRIGDAIKRMINRAISKINDGIAEVDRFLPGDLPRIPQLKKGGIAHAQPGGMIAQIAEGGEDEVVSPLSSLKKMLADVVGNREPSITFGPGAVQVTFEGVVPTAEQARQTGNMVGVGILDALTKRNIMTTVRAA